MKFSVIQWLRINLIFLKWQNFFINMNHIKYEERYLKVYKEMGPGFLEAVYQENVEKEFVSRTAPFVSQKPVNIKYKDEL